MNLFSSMMYCLTHSTFKESRKKIINLIEIPDPTYLKYILTYFIPRLLDSEIEVRIATYKKLINYKVTLQDINASIARMAIIKEGLTDFNKVQDFPKKKVRFENEDEIVTVRDHCLRFLK